MLNSEKMGKVTSLRARLRLGRHVTTGEMRSSALGALGADLGQQIGEGLDVVVVKRDELLEGFGIASETFPESFRRRVVKEGDVFVEVRDDEGVAQLLGALHGADSATEDGLEVANRDQRLYVEQLITARLKETGGIGGAVIAGE